MSRTSNAVSLQNWGNSALKEVLANAAAAEFIDCVSYAHLFRSESVISAKSRQDFTGCEPMLAAG